jgi:hypothetical protein
MASKQDLMRAFNNQFEEMLDDVERIFPKNKDIVASKSAIMMMKKANPKMLINIWKMHVYDKYSLHIDAGDIDYFLNKDYAEDLEMDQSSSKKVLEGIDRLRQPIKDMDQEHKNIMLQYLRNMNNLTKLYFS